MAHRPHIRQSSPRAPRPGGRTRERWQRRTYVLGARLYPSIVMPYATFAEAVADRDEPTYCEDLFLATACECHCAGAWEQLQQRYTKPLRALLRRRGCSARDTRDFLGAFWGTLATPPRHGATATRLGAFDGRGSLYSWLATVSWRRLADQWRARDVETVSHGLDQRTGTTADPANAVANEECERIVMEAMQAAWTKMSVRQLQVVVLKYQQGLRQRDIAQMLHISAPRVTNILKAAVKKLRASINSALAAEGLQVDEDWPSLILAVDHMLARADANPGGRNLE